MPAPAPVLVGSANADVGFEAGWAILSSGGTALDAVEAVTRMVESNPDDHTVGYGGLPNLMGEVELDASIMEGTNRRAGAVGALEGHRHAITLARAVMDRLPHVLVVGAGAARFAAELGWEPEDLLTHAARKVWEDGLAGRLEDDTLGARMMRLVSELTVDPERAGGHRAGTVDVLARDLHGHIASAVPTSGWAWKHPGRLGDSPLIGAGNYCDDRWGAAGCTGFGELAIRGATAHTIVAGMAAGLSVAKAARQAVLDLFDLGVAPGDVVMRAVAIDASGDPDGHAGVSTGEAEYVVQTDDHGLRRLPRTVISP